MLALRRYKRFAGKKSRRADQVICGLFLVGYRIAAMSHDRNLMFSMVCLCDHSEHMVRSVSQGCKSSILAAIVAIPL